MSAVPAVRSARRFLLQPLAGPRKGEKIYFGKPSILIGRGPENDLILDYDPQVSRAHVEIRNNDGQFSIHNITEKNVLLVNGQNVRNAVIDGDCKLQIGQSEFYFQAEPLPQVTALPPAVQLAVVNGQAAHPNLNRNTISYQTPSPAQMAAGGKPPPFRMAPPSGGGGSKMLFYVVIGVLVAAVALFSTGVTKKKAPVTLRTIEDVEKDVEVSTNSTMELEKDLERRGRNSPQYQIAQQHYVRGRRDYNMGQYGRAIQSLNAALTFYPQHDLAKRYLSLAQRKLDQEVKGEMILGQKYKGQQNYRLCVAAYEKVLRLINYETNDLNYKEAVQYQRECDMLQRDHY